MMIEEKFQELMKMRRSFQIIIYLILATLIATLIGIVVILIQDFHKILLVSMGIFIIGYIWSSYQNAKFYRKHGDEIKAILENQTQ